MSESQTLAAAVVEKSSGGRQTVTEWWLYMIATVSGKLYTGITTDVDRRFAEHVGDKSKQAKFFRSDAAQAIVYRERCDNRSLASKREAAIKKMRRADKLILIKRYQSS